jgi:hypothetical protein
MKMSTLRLLKNLQKKLAHAVFKGRFFIKTFLYRYVPGGYGYIRRLRNYKDTSYGFDKEKHPLRNKHHGMSGWREEKIEGIISRDYESYDEYVTHQSLKLMELLKLRGGFSNEAIADYRMKFYRRFRHLHCYLPYSAVIVCAGARQGTEVEVLRDLGFRNAIGIDLNPGPNNLYVVKGDFMNMEYEDNSIDCLYTNCIDHAFDLKSFFAEHARVVKPNGYVIYDFSEIGDTGAFEAVGWEDLSVPIQLILLQFKELIRAERDASWLWVFMKGKKR